MRASRPLLRSLHLLVTFVAALTGHAAAGSSYCTAIYATAGPTTSGGPSRHLFLNTITGTTADYDTIDNSKVTNSPGTYSYNATALSPLDGQLYYVERTGGTLLRYNPATRQTTRVAQNDQLRNNNNTYGSIIGAAIEETGKMYIYHSFGYVSIFQSTTGTRLAIPTKITYPTSFVPTASGTNGDIVLGAGNQLYIIVEGSLNGGAAGSHLIAISDSLVAGTITPITVNGAPLTALNGLAIEPFRTLPNGTTVIGETYYLSSSSNMYTMAADGKATNIETASQGITDLASCNVVPDRPSLSKVFEPPFVSAPGGTSRLTITVGNNNKGPVTLYTDLVDPLPSSPAQMTFAPTPNISGTCDNSRITLNSSSTPPELRFKAGAYIPVGGCTLQVNVTVPQSGTYRNTIVGSTIITSADVVQESATATLYTALGVSKTFSPALRQPGQTTTLTVTLSNPNSADTTSLNVEDRVAETTGVSGLTLGAVQGNTCGGTVSTAGGVLTIGGTTLRAGASCSVSLPVTLPAGTPSGQYTNTILPTQVSATFNDGVRTSSVFGAQRATASVTVTPFALVSSAVRTTQSPSTVTNPHRLTPGVTGPVTFTLSRPGGARFQYLLWYDADGNGEVSSGDAAIIPAGQTSGTLDVTDSFPKRPDGTPADVNLLVQVLVPPGLAAGLSETVTLGAAQTTGGATRTASLTDTTVIGQSGGAGGSLTLGKFVRNVTAGGPFSLNASTGGVGEQLEYCINYLNQGVGPLSEVVITDPIPFFTQPLGDGYAPGQGVRLVRGAAVQAGQTVTPGSAASNLSSAADADAGTLGSNRLTVTVGALGGGEQGTACYRVQIR
ncbi:hypothetical protein [Deinococcus depolymerans]|uniref:DUF7933 domain-containing protein n=1 Tax=Deinococcus depolymerans TaxID=392408 RepID=A0ABP3LKC4_9DEIO